MLDLNLEAAILAMEQFEFAKADTILKNAISQYETINPQHLNLAPALTQQAMLYTTIGRNDEALQLYQRADSIVRAVNPAASAVAIRKSSVGKPLFTAKKDRRCHCCHTSCPCHRQSHFERTASAVFGAFALRSLVFAQ
ncbi:MAG: tetratricopeptide repeat protein [Saprospiraceae bacterium]|nr:tetratricopeptide repeat protein [Saprospiraceae bacterium]